MAQRILVTVLIMVAVCSAAESGFLAKRDKLYDVKIVEDNVWIVGYPGILVTSSDRGVTWVHRDIDTKEALFAIDFIDTATGWIAGRSGSVFHTTDGGSSWAAQDTGVREHLFDLQFVDDRRGWAVGYFGTILRTLDGGETWEKYPLGEYEDPSLNSLCFVDSQNGWVVGEFGKIYHTSDGGDTWKTQDSGIFFSLFGVAFSDGSTGYAVGSRGAIVKTVDGGRHWRVIPSDVTFPLASVVLNDDDVIVVGQRGSYLEKSGSAFVSEPQKTYNWFSAVAFDDSGFGILVGGAGTVLKTVDSGKGWTPVQEPVGSDDPASTKE